MFSRAHVHFTLGVDREPKAREALPGLLPTLCFTARDTHTHTHTLRFTLLRSCRLCDVSGGVSGGDTHSPSYYSTRSAVLAKRGLGGRRKHTQLAHQMEPTAPSREEAWALMRLTSKALGCLNNLGCFSQEGTAWFCQGEAWMESQLPSGLPVYVMRTGVQFSYWYN